MAETKQKTIKELLDQCVYYLDDDKGKELYNSLKEKGFPAGISPEEKTGIMTVLEFLIIPHLSSQEISGLLRDNLYVGLNIDDLDITERIKKRLLFMHIADRDNFKKELKNSLINNLEQITEEVKNEQGKALKSTNDWLLDHIAQTDKKSGKILNQAEYLYQKKYVAGLKEEEKNNVKQVVSLFIFLNTSSLTPQGFEDDMLLRDKNGRLITTHKGKVVVLYDPNKKDSTAENRPKARQVSGPPKTEEEKEIADLKDEEKKYKEGGLEQLALEEEIDKKKDIEELEIMAKKYKENSLEQKALMEEIARLKKR